MEICTCGARLPEDALFCHKCGKAQRDVLVPEVATPTLVKQPAAAPPTPPVAAEPLPPNFRNPTALRIALVVAGGATLLSFLPYLNWLAAGYFAVFFYRRRTGHRLNLGAGVRMGWITGLLMFIMLAILFAAFVVLFKTSGGVEMFQQLNANDPRIQAMLALVQSGPGIANLLMQLFIFTTCLSMAGGALGAKLAGRG